MTATASIDMHTAAFPAFDTVCSIRIPKEGCSEQRANAALSKAMHECARYEQLFSAFIPTSDISRANTAQGMETAVSPETADIVAASLPYCERYPDVFDIGIGTAARLWSFHAYDPHVASADDCLHASRHTDYRFIHADTVANTIRIDDPETAIDLGATAKGYIADRMVALLKEFGIEHAIIDLGGTIYLIGSRPSGERWVAGIEDPRSDATLFRFRARNLAIATSSVSIRAFDVDGMHYHHILNPRTGWPCETDLLSASIISTSALKADCLATIAIGLGMEAAQAMIESEGVAGVLLRNDGELYASPALL